MKDLSIVEIRYFMIVAEQGNISNAAAMLFITQPALSRHMMNLEEALQFPVFKRSRSGVTLTAKGQAFYEHCKKVISAVDELNAQIAALRGDFVGSLRVGYPKSNEDIMLKIQKDLLKKYSNISLVLARQGDNNFIKMLEDGLLDVALIYDNELGDANSKIEAVPIGELPSMVLLSADNKLAEKRFLTFADLKDEKFVMPMRSVHPEKLNAIIAACAENHFVPNICAYERQFTNIVLQVKAQNAIFITPYVRSAAADDGIVFVPLMDFAYKYKVSLCWLKKSANPAIEKLAEVLQENGEKTVTKADTRAQMRKKMKKS